MRKLKEIKIYDLLLAICITSSLILFDLMLKNISYIHFYGKHKVIIKYIFEYSYVENRGVAFALLEGKKAIILAITLIAAGVFSYLLTYADLKKKKLFTLTYIFILAGTLGNAIDRISYGFVIDFIIFPFINTFIGLLKIPGFTCNVADIYLTVGIVLFIIDTIIGLVQSRKKKDSNIIYKNENNK